MVAGLTFGLGVEVEVADPLLTREAVRRLEAVNGTVLVGLGVRVAVTRR
jgi:hypothetical protein